jgi:hypothetical protein
MISFRSGVSNKGPVGCIWPSSVFVRPANILKTDNIINLAYFQSFSSYLQPAKVFMSILLRPAEHFLFGMWTTDQFEFETFDLDGELTLLIQFLF